MKVDGKVDYATHKIKADLLLKEVHKLLLNQEFVAAAATIEQAIVELRLMRGAVKSHVE